MNKIHLPQNFYFTTYSEGDDIHWAEIETSVGEFDTEDESIKYFHENYLCHREEVSKRVFFLKTSNNRKIGTISSWWNFLDGKKVSSIHWVAIIPEFQGKGLGELLINYGIEKQIEIDGDKDIYLHTQTWSYRAVYLYLKQGFQFLKKGSFGKYQNDYDKAMPIIKEKIGC